MKVNNSLNHYKAGFQGKIENDIQSMANLLQNRYGVDAHFNPLDRQGAQEMVETVQRLDQIEWPQPASVYTSVGEYIEDHPDTMRNVKDLMGQYVPNTSSIFVRPDPQSRVEYEHTYAAGHAACERPASHEAGHVAVRKFAGNGTNWGLHQVRLSPTEATIAARALSLYAGYNPENGTLVPQRGIELCAEHAGVLIEGKRKLHPVVDYINNHLLKKAKAAAIELEESQDC